MRWIALQALRIEPLAGVPSVSSVSNVDGATAAATSVAGTRQVITTEAVQLAICAISLSFTPRVSVCGSAVVIEVSGSLRLFGGLHKLAALLAASRERVHQHEPERELEHESERQTSLFATPFDLSEILRKPLHALDSTASLQH